MPKKQGEKSKSKIGSGAKLDMKKKGKDNKVDKSEVESIQEAPLEKEKQDKKDKNNKKDKKQLEKSKSKDKDKKDKDKKDKKKEKEQKKKKGKGKGQQQIQQAKMTSSLLEKQKDPEEQTIQNINKSSEKVKGTIQSLIQQYKDVAGNILFNNRGSDPQREAAIQRQLDKLQREKEERHKKLQQLQKHKQQIYESRLKQKEVKQELRKERLKERKLQKIQQKMKSLEQNAQHRKQEHKKFIEYVKERKKVVPRYKKYDQEYRQKEEANSEVYQQTVQELKKKVQPMSQQQLQQFESQYIHQLQQGEQYRANKLKLQAEMLNEQHKKLQQKLWKGRCHQIVKEQINSRLQKKQELKNKMMVRKQFSENVVQPMRKDLVSPKEEQNNNQESDSRIEKTGNTYMREKYFQGVNYGLVTQEKTVPLPLEDKNRLGNSYLTRVNELNKHRKNKTVDYGTPSNKSLSDSQELRQKSKTFKIKRKTNPYYIEDMNHLSINLSNYESIDYAMQKIGTIAKQKKLQEQIIKHGQFGSILQIQERKRNAGKIAIKQINDKLNVLEKL